MPLLREEFKPEIAETPAPTKEQYHELANAILNAGYELVRSSCSILGKNRIQEIDGVSWTTERAYHLQDDLPPDHEVAVWATFDRGTVRLLQNVVRWDGAESDREVDITKPRLLLERPQGFGDEVMPTIYGVDPNMSHDEVMDRVWDTHETLVFFARAMGYEPRPIEY